MLIFGFYIAQNNKNPHVTLFKHCISKTARYSILTPLVKKSYLGDKLLNPEYQVIASRPFIYQQIQCVTDTVRIRRMLFLHRVSELVSVPRHLHFLAKCASEVRKLKFRNQKVCFRQK